MDKYRFFGESNTVTVAYEGQHKIKYHASIEGRHILLCLRMDRYLFYRQSNTVTVPYEGRHKIKLCSCGRAAL
jgi:hypothetical protein